MDFEHLELYAWGTNPEPYACYQNDGETKEYDMDKCVEMLTP